MRLFIAIDVTELAPYFKELQAKIPLDGVKIKLTDSFHLTLKFLGEVPDTNIVKIDGFLKKIQFVEFPITFNHLGFFPNENYVRVLWVGLKEYEKAVGLQRMVDTNLISMFKKENDYHPHITLSRLRFVKDPISFVGKIKCINVDEITFTVTHFKLIQSALTEQGAIYKDLKVYGI